MADIEALKRALVNADKAGDVEAAKVLAQALRVAMEAPQAEQQPADPARIAQAFEVAEKPAIESLPILPATSINGGPFQFDMNAGVPGMIKRGLTAPGDALAGRIPMIGPDGRTSPEMIARVTETAALSPAGMAGRLKMAVRPGDSSIELINQISRLPKREAAKAIQDARSFGIDLSRGQATRNVKQQAFEEDALSGGRGGMAQSIIGRQRETQYDQLRSALDRIKDDIAPPPQGEVSIMSPQDQIYAAARNTGEAVATKAGELKTKATAAYKAAEDFGGEISPQAVQELNTSLMAKLDELGAMEGTAIGADLPVVKRIMGRVNDLAGLKNAPAGKVVGIGWQNVERIRKQVSGAAGSSPNEERVLSGIKRSLDDWLEKTVDDGLVSGSPEFLSALKGARGMWSEYKSISKSPTQIIRKMAERQADSVEIANWIYGANKVGGRAQSAAVVREIKKILGDKNPAITDLRRNVLTKLFEDVSKGEIKTYGRLASELGNFVNGQGRELASALYDKGTLFELNRLVGVLRNMTPDNVAMNPSRSGQTAVRRFSEASKYLLPAIGYSVGDLSGALAGLGLSFGAKTMSAARARASVAAPVPSAARNVSPLPMNAGLRALMGSTPSLADARLEQKR